MCTLIWGVTQTSYSTIYDNYEFERNSNRLHFYNYQYLFMCMFLSRLSVLHIESAPIKPLDIRSLIAAITWSFTSSFPLANTPKRFICLRVVLTLKLKDTISLLCTCMQILYAQLNLSSLLCSSSVYKIVTCNTQTCSIDSLSPFSHLKSVSLQYREVNFAKVTQQYSPTFSICLVWGL